MRKLLDNLMSLAFAGYMILLIYFLFFSEEYGRTVHYTEYQYNLVLFHEISRYIKYREIVGIEYFLINIVGNIVVFMPFGFFVPNLKKWDFLRVVIAGFFFSLAVETVQLVTKVGTFDVDDLLLNTIGVMLGCICYCFCRKIYRVIRKKKG
ncbi:MAG: VanZ family protein [Eubacterium sp.]